jgi:hypothetical protein
VIFGLSKQTGDYATFKFQPFPRRYREPSKETQSREPVPLPLI